MNDLRVTRELSYFLAFVFAASVALFLVSLPIDAFKDRLNYLIYAEDSYLIFQRYLSRGLLPAVFNEPIWLFLNISLSSFLSPESTLKTIIAFSSFITSYLVLKNNPKYFLIVMLFLISPQVIGKNIIHLRQGLAIAFFLLGWYSIGNKKKLFFYAITPFIHASFFFILLLVFIKWVADKLKLAPDLKTITYALAGVAVGLGLGVIASFLGSRQGTEYSFSMANVSGLGFIFWLGVLGLYISQGKNFIRDNTFQVGLLVFYLATYFLIEVTGRIFESGVLLVLLSALSLVGWRKYTFIGVFIVYTLLQYAMRFNQPWLGWGTGV